MEIVFVYSSNVYSFSWLYMVWLAEFSIITPHTIHDRDTNEIAVLGCLIFYVHCVFSGGRSREFVRILSDGEMAEVLDLGGDSLRVRPLRDDYLAIEIELKGDGKGFVLDKHQAQGLSNWFQRVYKL